jgi:hypothetical protein
MAEEATRAAEGVVEQQLGEAYQTVTLILNEQPISTVLEAFWDILLAKPHRSVLSPPLLVSVNLQAMKKISFQDVPIHPLPRCSCTVVRIVQLYLAGGNG